MRSCDVIEPLSI